MIVIVPASGFLSAMVSGIRSPCSSRRTTTNCPAAALRATRGATISNSVTVGAKARLVIILKRFRQGETLHQDDTHDAGAAVWQRGIFADARLYPSPSGSKYRDGLSKEALGAWRRHQGIARPPSVSSRSIPTVSRGPKHTRSRTPSPGRQSQTQSRAGQVAPGRRLRRGRFRPCPERYRASRIAADEEGFLVDSTVAVHRPDTPRPWLHLMGSNHDNVYGVVGSFWDVTGLGFLCYESVLAGAVTSHKDSSYVPTAPPQHRCAPVLPARGSERQAPPLGHAPSGRPGAGEVRRLRRPLRPGLGRRRKHAPSDPFPPTRLRSRSTIPVKSGPSPSPTNPISPANSNSSPA